MVDKRAEDTTFEERITRLEARLADSASNPDAHATALYSGIRSLVAELIRRRRKTEQTCETLAHVLEATSDAFVALDSQWRYTYVNARAGQMFGRAPESSIGKNIWAEFPEGIGQPFHLEYERAVADGQPHQIEAYYPPYDRWFENRIFPYAGGLAIFFQDVTERRTAADRLRESEQRYRSLFEQHPDAVYSFDVGGRFTSANAACEGLTGYTIDELIGTPFATLVVPEDRERATQYFLTTMGGKATSYDETIVHKSGRRVEISITKLPIVVDGEVVCIYGISKDLTRQRELEWRLQQAQRIEAVGRMAGGVAHDFNNLLTIIQNCASFLARDIPPISPSHGDVEEIQNAARRAGELTQQLLAFSRKQILRPQPMDVNQQVLRFVATLRRVVADTITIETDLAPNTWPIFADSGQIDRVLMNLGLNARDAMPNGGTIRLRTENVVVGRDGAGSPAPGNYVELTIEDTGTGIDPTVLPFIFEPFVTTKPPGAGTGLGLSTVHGIVEQSGGVIRASNKPGGGTRFSVFLPKAVTAADAAVA